MQISGYPQAIWTKGLQDHRYNKVSEESSSPHHHLTRSVHHVLTKHDKPMTVT